MVQQIQQSGPLVWINAFAGVGKLTIARELVKLMGGSDKVILIGNHTLIDVVKLTRDHADYQPQRREGEDHRVHGLPVQQRAGWLRGAGVRGRGAPVYLECGKVETVRRATLPERSVEGKGKLVDEAVLRAFLDAMGLFEFEGVEGLRLDVTARSPAGVAAELAGFIGS
ncbi:hypothetical protein SCUP234_03925 [Seiridium cupressi]